MLEELVKTCRTCMHYQPAKGACHNPTFMVAFEEPDGVSVDFPDLTDPCEGYATAPAATPDVGGRAEQ